MSCLNVHYIELCEVSRNGWETFLEVCLRDQHLCSNDLLNFPSIDLFIRRGELGSSDKYSTVTCSDAICVVVVGAVTHTWHFAG